MNNAGPSNSSGSLSSGTSEKLTIAYTEFDMGEESPEPSESSQSRSSSSLDTPTSLESVTSLFQALEHMRETERYFGYEPLSRTMSSSEGPKTQALEYFWAHSVFQLFTFMMSHLLAVAPENPVHFLESLVDRCVRYRDLDEDPPLLFQDSHILSVYTALDPLEDGVITYRQYLTGMSTLGVYDFNVIPDDMDHKNRDIPRQVFLDEAKKALLRQLDHMIGKTQPSENGDERRSKTNSNSETEKLIRSGDYSDGSVTNTETE